MKAFLLTIAALSAALCHAADDDADAVIAELGRKFEIVQREAAEIQKKADAATADARALSAKNTELAQTVAHQAGEITGAMRETATAQEANITVQRQMNGLTAENATLKAELKAETARARKRGWFLAFLGGVLAVFGSLHLLPKSNFAGKFADAAIPWWVHAIAFAAGFSAALLLVHRFL